MEASGLSQLKPTNLRQQARAAIQAQIVTGGVEVGEIYPVSHFSSQLGVSATPVREALFDLSHEGLVELVRNRGFRVVALSEKDLDEILELRLLLEVPAIQMAAGSLTQEDVERCLGFARVTEDSARKADLAGFLTADRHFHLGLFDRIENRRLVEIIGRLRDQARLPGLRFLAESGTLAAAADEHYRILKVVEKGDSEEAASLLRGHLLHTRGIWAGRPEPKATA
jgi:DNA-binding GntR family transcriptional regulator